MFLTGDTEEGDYLEYRITGNINVEKFRILQNGSSNADVLVEKPDGTMEKLGELTDTDQIFEAPEGGIYAVRLEFRAGIPAEISEIVVTYGEDASGDIGQAVENIYLDDGTPDSTETVNLALNQPVEVSGIEVPSVKPESAVDRQPGYKMGQRCPEGRRRVKSAVDHRRSRRLFQYDLRH